MSAFNLTVKPAGEFMNNGGTFRIITTREYEDSLAAKDARIAELEARLALPREAGGYCIVPKEDYDAMKFRIGDLEDAITKNAKAANAKEKRLSCEEGKYDKCGVGGISLDGATKAAELAESMLNSDHKLSYAAACLLVLHRELANVREKQRQDEARRSMESSQRIKNLVKEIDVRLTKYAENW